jgi:hypothetical protein
MPKDKDVPARLLTTIQLVLSNRSLSFFKPLDTIYGFPDAQFAAYLPATHAKGNMFSDTAAFKVNVEWCLNIVNFFRHHLIGRDEFSMMDAYQELDTISKGRNLPQYWKEQLTDDQSSTRKPLGQHWKGTYGKWSKWDKSCNTTPAKSILAYLDRTEMPIIRRSTPGQAVFPDRNVDLLDKAIQTLQISFPEEAPFPWPKHFENHLKSRTYRVNRPAPSRPQRRTRAQHQRSNTDPFPTLKGMDYRFEGQGYDEE